LAQIAGELGPGQHALRTRMETAIALCSDALEDTRQLSRLLRPPILDDLGLVPALQWLGRSVGEASGMAVVVEIDELPPLGGELQTLLFRVAQEALNNVARHARASSVLLRLVARHGELQLQVIDDGAGFDPADARGSGLGGMRERLRLHDGRLELRSAPGQGTRLRAVVPIAEGGPPA
jgi:signal transduction histidine kinase